MISDLGFINEKEGRFHFRDCQAIPSLVKWSGSKRSQAKEIHVIAPSFDRYIEPFLGGGAILFMAAHPGAIANDIYEPLIDLWRLVRDEPGTLIKTYSDQWGKLSRELDSVDIRTMTRGNGIPRVFYEIRDEFNKSPNAIGLNFLMRTCVNGIVRFNDKGHFNNSFHLSRRGMMPNRFASVVNAWTPILKGVDFQCKDYREVLAEARSGDFVYLDPPYAATRQRYSTVFEIKHLFTELERLNHRGVKWALSFDGKRGGSDFTHNVPQDLYKTRAYLHSGNSAVKKVLSGPLERVEEALYLNY